jgi:CRP-like cAMP-binding protein
MSDEDGREHRRGEASGHHNARARVARMLCDLIDDTGDASVEMPLSIVPASHALGLTPVHFNVTMNRLGVEGLVAIAGHTVKILDLAQLRRIAALTLVP